MNFEDDIKDKLNVKKLVRIDGNDRGACISKGSAYRCDDSFSIFVKSNGEQYAEIMFDGELESLNALRSTETIRVPKPYFTVTDQNTNESIIVMEFVDNLKRLTKFQSQLGTKLAELHLYNKKLGEVDLNWIGRNRDAIEKYVEQFGFHTITSCGYYPLDNEWCSNWIEFYARNRLDNKINSLLTSYGDRELNELWSKLQLIIPRFFTEYNEENKIIPALLHGDLWTGNAGETSIEPVVYDPGSFYGHSEFDLSIGVMFGGFNKEFENAYHTLIPKANGFKERSKLYQLFHNLNHWHHFGSGYKHESINIMRSLCRHT